MSKKYKVVFTYIESDGTPRDFGDEDMFVPLSREQCIVEQAVVTQDGKVVDVQHSRVGPWASTKEPFIGELTDAEVAFLRRLPGQGMHGHYSFAVSEVK